MTRTLIAVAALAVLAGPALAHAEQRLDANQMAFRYSEDRLATAAGVAAVKAKVAAEVDRFCRANPVGYTVSGCRKDLTAQLMDRIDLRAANYAKAHPSTRYAQR